MELYQYKFAGFWSRVLAMIIDCIVFFPLIAFNYFNILDIKMTSLLVCTSLAGFLYKPLMEYKLGATIGKKVLDLKVISTEGAPITLMQALKRSIFYSISGIISFLISLWIFCKDDFDQVTTMKAYVAVSASVPTYLNTINMLVSFVFILSCVMVAFQKNKQGAHDLFAETYCIHTQPEATGKDDDDE